MMLTAAPPHTGYAVLDGRNGKMVTSGARCEKIAPYGEPLRMPSCSCSPSPRSVPATLEFVGTRSYTHRSRCSASERLLPRHTGPASSAAGRYDARRGEARRLPHGSRWPRPRWVPVDGGRVCDLAHERILRLLCLIEREQRLLEVPLVGELHMLGTAPRHVVQIQQQAVRVHVSRRDHGVRPAKQ